jgi:hypothetical protein
MLLANALHVVLALAQSSSWRELFNGRDLAGWEEHSGTAGFAVEDDAIVGTTVVGSGNTFLCTEREFGDFELELEFLVDPALNSGVQVRSEVFPDARRILVAGKEIALEEDRVHGYQVEIDMDPARGRWWAGGLYDEARRGWMCPHGDEKGAAGAAFTEQGKRIGRPGEWNTLRVVALGPELRTWLNGEARARIVDRLTPRGVIGLQVHGIGDDASKAGLHVRFRKIRLREFGEWRALFDGADAGAWRSATGDSFPARGWTIAGGVLSVEGGGGGEAAGGGDLLTRERFADFELALDFRLTPGANSGIKYFVQPDLRPIDGSGQPAATGSAIGCEFQLLDDERHPDARLGRDGNRTLASLYDLIRAAPDKPIRTIGEWSNARIVARGTHVEHWLNDVKVVEYERGSDAFRALVAGSKYRNIAGFGEWPDGHVLLQDHGDPVSFRDIRIRSLPEP